MEKRLLIISIKRAEYVYTLKSLELLTSGHLVGRAEPSGQ